MTAFVKYETAIKPPKMSVTVDTETTIDLPASEIELKEIDEFETHEIFCTMKDDEVPETIKM